MEQDYVSLSYKYFLSIIIVHAKILLLLLLNIVLHIFLCFLNRKTLYSASNAES